MTKNHLAKNHGQTPASPKSLKMLLSLKLNITPTSKIHRTGNPVSFKGRVHRLPF